MTQLIALEYGKSIIKEVTRMDKLIKEFLIPSLGRISGDRLDDIDFKDLAGVALVAAIILKIKSIFYGEALAEDQEPNQRFFSSLMRNKVSIFTDRVNKEAEKSFVKEYRRQTKTDPPKINVKEFIDDATQKNVALIKTIPSQYFEKIQSLVSENVDSGMLTRDFSKQLREISDVSKKRARLIANDQVNKLKGKLNEVRQRNLGVEEYIWRTSQDSRVRSLANSKGYSDHERLNGTRQRWDDPPITVFRGKRAGARYHASQDIGCR